MFKKGQSGNPKGKPPGALGACTKVKNDYFKVYEKLGGYKGFLKYLLSNRALWPDYYLKVLPMLMPKRTELQGNISGTLVIKIKGKHDDNEPSGSPGTERG